MTATLRVAGSARCSAAPDQVQIRLATERTAATAPAALEEASSAANALVAAIKRTGVPDSDLQTAGLSLDRQWNPEAGREEGYLARHRFTITAPVAAASELIAEAAAAAGDAIRIESVGLALSDPGPLRERAQRDAFDDARNQAAELARLAGRSLGPVLSMDTTADHSVSPMPRGVMFAEAASVVEAGEIGVSATVVVVYELV